VALIDCTPANNVVRSRTSSGDVSLLLSPMRLASLQQLCRIVIRRLLSRDKVEHLLCMPLPIRRYLQYDRQPVSACGWVSIESLLHCCVGPSVRTQSANTRDRYACLAVASTSAILNVVASVLPSSFWFADRFFSCVIFCCRYIPVVIQLTIGAYTFTLWCGLLLLLLMSDIVSSEQLCMFYIMLRIVCTSTDWLLHCSGLYIALRVSYLSCTNVEQLNLICCAHQQYLLMQVAGRYGRLSCSLLMCRLCIYGAINITSHSYYLHVIIQCMIWQYVCMVLCIIMCK